MICHGDRAHCKAYVSGCTLCGSRGHSLRSGGPALRPLYLDVVLDHDVVAHEVNVRILLRAVVASDPWHRLNLQKSAEPGQNCYPKVYQAPGRRRCRSRKKWNPHLVEDRDLMCWDVVGKGRTQHLDDAEGVAPAARHRPVEIRHRNQADVGDLGGVCQAGWGTRGVGGGYGCWWRSAPAPLPASSGIIDEVAHLVTVCLESRVGEERTVVVRETDLAGDRDPVGRIGRAEVVHFRSLPHSTLIRCSLLVECSRTPWSCGSAAWQKRPELPAPCCTSRCGPGSC